jgi:hypothetical protein
MPTKTPGGRARFSAPDLLPLVSGSWRYVQQHANASDGWTLNPAFAATVCLFTLACWAGYRQASLQTAEAT